MAVFLTKNSQPQRTSPVKRGFWVVHKLLGEHIPPPPPDVAITSPSDGEPLAPKFLSVGMIFLPQKFSQLTSAEIVRNLAKSGLTGSRQ